MKQDFRVLSNIKCKNFDKCEHFIKKNMLDKKPDTDTCYSCFRKEKGLLPRKEAHKTPKVVYKIGSKCPERNKE